jgi:60S ribosome subunit biogenesis protein NIP7
MRQLTEDETKVFFTKLSSFIGDNIRFLIDRPDAPHVFRLHKERVYYMPETLYRLVENASRKDLICAGVCFGKFTKGGKFHIHISCLDLLAKYARYKVWLKPSGEQNFMYGNNALKVHMAKITEATPQYAGVVVCTMGDLPIGFGVAGRSTD